MQTRIAPVLKQLCLAVALMSLSSFASALEPNAAVKAETLLKTTSTWDGQPIAWPQGKAELTAMRIEIAPGAETGWHAHGVPSFAVMLEGTLEVSLADGRVKRLQAGDVLAEVVNTTHIGHNIGTMPVRLVVFYTGIAGQATSAPASPKTPAAVGADRDAHGCIGSAGYVWCAKESACVRPWELARQKGFDAGSDSFKRYCEGAAAP
ncbi:MAG: hypothetical protein H6R04_373 [Burkholderiaceae bacterium]|nr:hypothetical protein [Burkholderiaceae bacterium]